MTRRRPSAADTAAAYTTAIRLAGHEDVPRADLAAAVRAVCGLLAYDHPGGTLEVRVPPFAAIQAGIGERGAHTRGTPPNVVETDAATLLSLAAGTLAWADAVAARRVHVGGVHAEIGGWFPCLRPEDTQSLHRDCVPRA